MSIAALESTTVTFFFNKHDFSLPVSSYTLTLNRVTGNTQRMCQDFADGPLTSTANGEKDGEVLVQTFLNIQEYSSYRVLLTANFDVFATPGERITHTTIETLAAGN